MSPSRRQRSRSAAAVAVFLAATLTVIGFSGTAGAARQTGEGSATGIVADSELLDIQPTPLAEFPPGERETELEVDLSPLVLACVLTAESRGQQGEGGFVRSEASVAQATILGEDECPGGDNDGNGGGGGGDGGGLLGDGLLGDGLLGGGDNNDGGDGLDLGEVLEGLLGDDALLDLGGDGIFVEAITSECRADADGVEGDSEVVGLEEDTLLGLDGLELDLGILEVAVGEEIVDERENSIIVRGLRVTLLPDDGGEPLLEVILAESRCQFDRDKDKKDDKKRDKCPEKDKCPDKDRDKCPEKDKCPDKDRDKCPDRSDEDRDEERKRRTPTRAEAANNAEVSNDSDGTAIIETGDATAIGNQSNTEITQQGAAQGGGGRGGGDAEVDQSADVNNEGDADANTGGNSAIGNNSQNQATSNQDAAAASGRGGANVLGVSQDDGRSSDAAAPGAGATASNNATASNSSDGTADVATGDANAAGNVSNTEINQQAAATGGDGSFFCDKDGNNCRPCDDDNRCWGCDENKRCNPCDDDDRCRDCDRGKCTCDCDDRCDDRGDDRCRDRCDGDDRCDNDPWGSVARGGGGDAEVDQSADVNNAGTATANTGGNAAVGNNSSNKASNTQSATAFARR